MPHTVVLLTPQGPRTIECHDHEDILSSAARQGVNIPSICRGGACSACMGRLVEGIPPDQFEQSYLNEGDLQRGYLLLCVAFAQGECTVRTHCQAEFEADLGVR